MIPAKPLYAELTQPLQRDLPGQRVSGDEDQPRVPLTRSLTRSLLLTEQDDSSENADDE